MPYSLEIEETYNVSVTRIDCRLIARCISHCLRHNVNLGLEPEQYERLRTINSGFWEIGTKTDNAVGS